MRLCLRPGAVTPLIRGANAIEGRIQSRDSHGFGVDIGGERFAFCCLRSGDGQHARAATEIQNAFRLALFQNCIKGEQAARRGAVMAGSESGSRINLKRHAAMAPAFAVMGAVEKKSSGYDGRQAFE